MPAERIAMRQVRDVLRLTAAGVSGNEIARRVGVASSTVRLTLKRLAAAGLGWPLPAELTDAALEGQLFSAVGKKQGHRRRGEPDWAAVHRELKRKHVTLQILWDEYIERHPESYRYSRFCELYRGWASRISVTMRQWPRCWDRSEEIVEPLRWYSDTSVTWAAQELLFGVFSSSQRLCDHRAACTGLICSFARAWRASISKLARSGSTASLDNSS